MNDEICTCESCTEEHTCPFEVDVNDDSEYTCTCCDVCQDQCADEI